MAETAPGLDIKVEPAPAGATPFIPGSETPPLEFELTPSEEPTADLTPYYPPRAPWTPVEAQITTWSSIVFDMETTGINPWDSRVICISYMNTADPELEAKTLYSENEEDMIYAFLQTLQDLNAVELIGYNLSFDMRFFWAKCMRYRIEARILQDVSTHDMMEVMEKTRPGYRYGRNKAGGLEDWSQFLFGTSKEITIPEMLRLWGQGDIEPIAAYNRSDVRKTYQLWALEQQVNQGITTPLASAATGEQPPAALTRGEGPPPHSTGELITGSPTHVSSWKRVISKNSYAEQWIPETATQYRDYITGLTEDV